MKRHHQIIRTLAAVLLLMAAGTGPAAGQPAMPPGNPSSLTALPQAPSAALSPQAVPAGQAAVRPGAADDIRDIRGPLHIPNPIFWLYYAMGTCLALAVAAAIWRWSKRHQALRAKRAYEIAFLKLEKAKALMKPDLAEAFSVAVSDAVRVYTEQRFEVRVTRHTTGEFMARIGAEPGGDLAEYRDMLRDFLSHCDLAKFACFLLTVDQMKEMHRRAWEFVDGTRPRPEEKAAEQRLETSDAVPASSAVRKVRSLSKILVSTCQRSFSQKTIASAGLNEGRAVAAGGR